MSSTAKSSRQGTDSDAENEHLMARQGHYDEEKDPNSSELFYTGRKQWMPLSKFSLITLLIITSLVTMFLSGLGLYMHYILNPQHTLPLPGTRFGSCGTTPASARQSNCTFDIMSFSWLPTPCSDPELTSEFSRLRNWTWWLDPDRTESVSFEEVSKGDRGQLFVSREYHMFHCTYMWRKLHRGMLRGEDNKEQRGVVDTYIGSYGHTAHCEMMLLGMEGNEGRLDKNATDTAIVMKFPQCMWA